MATHSVLVVDDDPDLREGLAELLSAEGYASAGVADGLAALEYLRANPPPALILLDWAMAPMNGLEFMGELSKDPALSTIPVVLLTADARLRKKTESASFVGALAKPVHLDELFDLLAHFASPAP